MSIQTDIMAIINKSNKPIKRKELLALLNNGLGYMELSDREMRMIIAEELPICSNDRGYYIPKNYDDIVAFKRYLESKSKGMFERFARIKKEYSNMIQNKQLNLFEKETQ